MTKTQSLHASTPWAEQDDTDIVCCHTGNFVATTHLPGEFVATQYEYDNAAFIVRAVNSHAALVEALEALLEYEGGPVDNEGEEVHKRARAALTLAKGA